MDTVLVTPGPVVLKQQRAYIYGTDGERTRKRARSSSGHVPFGEFKQITFGQSDTQHSWNVCGPIGSGLSKSRQQYCLEGAKTGE